VRRADKLATFMCRLSENPGSLNLHEPSGLIKAYAGIALPYLIMLCKVSVMLADPLQGHLITES
jgi:hypothetical protein